MIDMKDTDEEKRLQSISHLQDMIDHSDNDQKQMLEIGKSYLNGVVLKDLTAAEAWLTKAMNVEENALAVQAMELIGYHIAGREQILTDEDYQMILEKFSDPGEMDNEYLKALRNLGWDERLKRGYPGKVENKA